MNWRKGKITISRDEEVPLTGILVGGEGKWMMGTRDLVHIYRDGNDWWIGYYRGPEDHFVCLIPTWVIRWRRR